MRVPKVYLKFRISFYARYEDTGILPPEFVTRFEPVIVSEGEDVKLAASIKGIGFNLFT